MGSHEKERYIPDLSHLHDAFFETEDKDEETLIFAIIEQFEARESWPIEFYKKGFAAEHLKPYAVNALGRVVDNYDDEMARRKAVAEHNLRYPLPEVMPSRLTSKKPNKLRDDVDLDLAAVQVKLEAEEIPAVDLVSDSISAEKIKEEEGQEIVGMGSRHRGGGSKRKGKNEWVPSTIVCALRMPDGETVKSRKGKEKMVEGSEIRKSKRNTRGVERLNLGGSEKRTTGSKPKYLEEIPLAQDYSDYKLHDIFIEDDEEGWRKFCAAEKYDSGLDEGPDIPMSPPSCDYELDPNQHIFLLVKKGTTS